MAQFGSPRVANLFGKVEQRAARLTAIVEEETRLRRRLLELWDEKTVLMAHLADEARAASLAEIGEVLRRQRRAKR